MSGKKANNPTSTERDLRLTEQLDVAAQQRRLIDLHRRWIAGWDAPSVPGASGSAPVDLQQLADLVAMLSDVAFLPAEILPVTAASAESDDGATDAVQSAEGSPQGEFQLTSPPSTADKAVSVPQRAGRETIKLTGNSPMAETEASLASEMAATGPRDTLTTPTMIVSADTILATYEAGDYDSAYRLAEDFLRVDSENQDIQLVLLECQDELLKQFEAQVGSLKIKPTKTRDIDSDQPGFGEAAGYILERIDGSVSFEELFDRTTISTVDAYRIVTDLINQGIIAT